MTTKNYRTSLKEISGKVLAQSELEKIAKKDGFVFDKALSLGNTLYVHKKKNLKRVYDQYGGIVHTYTPKTRSQNTSHFHNPIEILPLNLTLASVNQFVGKSQRVY